MCTEDYAWLWDYRGLIVWSYTLNKAVKIKLISGNDSIISFLSCGTLAILIRLWVTALQSILWNMWKKFFQSWCSLCCMMKFARAFTTKQQVMHTHCIVYYDIGMTPHFPFTCSCQSSGTCHWISCSSNKTTSKLGQKQILHVSQNWLLSSQP